MAVRVALRNITDSEKLSKKGIGINSRLADYKSALLGSAMPFGTSRTAK
jgi:hypothetical protein